MKVSNNKIFKVYSTLKSEQGLFLTLVCLIEKSYKIYEVENNENFCKAAYVCTKVISKVNNFIKIIFGCILWIYDLRLEDQLTFLIMPAKFH